MKLLQNILIVSTLFIFLNCSNEKKTNPMSIKIGDKKVELKVENKKDYLVYDEPVEAEFVFTNIDINKGWTIMGRGIKILNSKKSSVITEINYYSQKSETDTLTIIVDFDGSEENDKKFKTIKVPVKRN